MTKPMGRRTEARISYPRLRGFEFRNSLKGIIRKPRLRPPPLGPPKPYEITYSDAESALTKRIITEPPRAEDGQAEEGEQNAAT